MTMPTIRNARLLYVADPMCSWCWGFSPVVAAIAERYGARVPVTVVLGGLRPGTTTPMDIESKAAIREHWKHVHEATAQPFDFAFFDRDGFVYDTEPACRAVVAARLLRADAALLFLGFLHAAFYRDNRDITDAATLTALAADFGFDEAAFADTLASDQARNAVRADFALAGAMGVRGFPSLVAENDEGRVAITFGYRPAEPVERAIESWLAS